MPGVIKLAAQTGKASFNASVFTKAIRHLHGAGAYHPEMLADKPLHGLVKETNRVLQAALDNGIADNTPSPAMLKKLREDVFLFSGCKTHKELKEAASWLLDDNGKVRPFNDFRNDVWKVHTAYNQHYLEAEYHFAIGSAQMAAKWADFEKDGDRYHLQYRTAGDDRVRPEHEELDLITLPADDRFWSHYYPPNGWRCRCTAVQVRAGKYPESDPGESERRGEAATTRIDKNGINADAIFRFNPGKDRQIFPSAHPYKKVQDSVKKIIEGLQVQEHNADFSENRKSVLSWAKANLVGKTIPNEFGQIGKDIKISTYGIKEFINQPHKFLKAKNESLKNIRDKVREAKYEGFVEDSKGRCRGFHYLKTRIAGEDSWIVIREEMDGTAKLYSMVDHLKK